MTWLTLCFILYLIELVIWGCVVYLHLAEKIDQTKMKFPKQTKVVVRTKRDIVRG
jgi:hypothetical protein